MIPLPKFVLKLLGLLLIVGLSACDPSSLIFIQNQTRDANVIQVSTSKHIYFDSIMSIDSLVSYPFDPKIFDQSIPIVLLDSATYKFTLPSGHSAVVLPGGIGPFAALRHLSAIANGKIDTVLQKGMDPKKFNQIQQYRWIRKGGLFSKTITYYIVEIDSKQR